MTMRTWPNEAKFVPAPPLEATAAVPNLRFPERDPTQTTNSAAVPRQTLFKTHSRKSRAASF
jgi:hypothetical protein